MSKSTENIEKVRNSWGSDNDGTGSTLDADLLDGISSEALPVSTPQQTALDTKVTGSWRYEAETSTLFITVPTA